MEIVELTPTSLNHLIIQLQMIINKCKEKEAGGFDSFMPHFQYEYHLGEEIAGHSVKSCPICRGFNDVIMFQGDEIEGEFPAVSRLSNSRIYPDVHETYPDMLGKCGCELDLINLSSACAESLADEMRMSVI